MFCFGLKIIRKEGTINKDVLFAVIWRRIKREETHYWNFQDYSFGLATNDLLNIPSYRIGHATVLFTPTVELWLEQERSVGVQRVISSMIHRTVSGCCNTWSTRWSTAPWADAVTRDQLDDPPHRERMLRHVINSMIHRTVSGCCDTEL